MKRTQLYIDENIYDAVAKEAKSEKKTVSGIIREMLSRELGKRKSNKSARSAELLKRLLDYAAEGPADLSAGSDDYLIEELTG